MTEKSINEVQIHEIFSQVAAESKNITIQHCESVWDSFATTVVSHSEPEKSVLVFDMFYITPKSFKGSDCYFWSPTRFLLNKCALFTQQEAPHFNKVTALTKQKLGKTFSKDQCASNFTNPQDIAWFILEHIFNIIKGHLQKANCIEINIGFFGAIKVYKKCISHIVRQSKDIRIKKLMTPRRKSSNLRISKRSSGNSILKQLTISNNSQDIHKVDKLFQKRSMNSTLSPFNFMNINNQKILNEKQTKQRSFLNNISIPDTRIPNDLLGAGIDPLKFDYNYSKLVNEPDQLFNQTFNKPKPPKVRHPGIIDKFERTTGVPQTGLKVSNSVIVRIASNYNLHAKNIYTNIKSKRIEFVPSEPKIFFKRNEQHQQCATEEQQYLFVSSGKGDPKKIEQRIKNYERYRRYIEKYIENKNVSPMCPQSVKRILSQFKAYLTKTESKQEFIGILNKSMNEANIEYYFAYKKSILDYILKDQKQRERTGIYTIFKGPTEWGQRKINKQSPLYTCTIDRKMRQKVMQALQSHLFHPQCVLQIANYNLKMREVDLFRIRNNDNKPVNVLYFIKKQNTHISDIMAYLSSDWIKSVASIVAKHIDFDEQQQSKTVPFIRLIDLMLANTLKNIVEDSLKKLLTFFQKFTLQYPFPQSPILQISIIDENGEFIFSDDFRKIVLQEMSSLIRAIIEQSKKIHGIQFYLKDDLNSLLWVDDQKYTFHQEIIEKISKVIQKNCEEIQIFRTQFQKYRCILKFQEETHEWLKGPRSIQEIEMKINQIEETQSIIQSIPYSFLNKMVLVECFDEKRKLLSSLMQLKYQLHQHIKSNIQRSNIKIYFQIDEVKRKISSLIQNTEDYRKVSNDLQMIKKRTLNQLLYSIGENQRALLRLLDFGYGPINNDLLEKVFRMNKSMKSLNFKIDYHEDRINRSRIQLDNILRQKIRSFETMTHNFLSTIVVKIDSFETRKFFNEYMIELSNFKSIVEENDRILQEINCQQTDLKWNNSKFKAVEQLKNLVLPNYELWSLVIQFDFMIKQWKNKEICQMDVANVKKRVEDVHIRVSKIIKKLKNLSSLKIAYQLQNDAKEILNEQIEIIQIFSHPGIKERHWQLFNSKLLIPGVDLKQITYNKIKIFAEYSKNLKILSAISAQAARQFDVQQQKNTQQQHWSSVVFETYTHPLENTFCIKQTFLKRCLQQLEQHSCKLSVMKNHIYSKMLYQQLQQWELWLSSSQKNLQNLKCIQTSLNTLKPLFTYDQIIKQLPLENSQFQSIDNYWKTLTKKIWEHSKLLDFMKSPKVSEMIDQVLKKIQMVKRGLSPFLMSKRAEFPRFYFLSDAQLIDILRKGAYSQTEKQAVALAFQKTFPYTIQLIQNEDKMKGLKSKSDFLNFTVDVYQLKSKKKVGETMVFLQKCMRQSTCKQIVEICYQNQTNIEKMVQKYSLGSIFSSMNIEYSIQVYDSLINNGLSQLIHQRRQLLNSLIQSSLVNGKASCQKDNQTKQKGPSSSENIIKIQKIIVSLFGQLQRLQTFSRIQSISVKSFQYLTMIKFQISQKGQNKKGIDESQNICQICPKQTKEKLSSVYKAISYLRRRSSAKPEIMKNFYNSSKINIECFGRTFQYKYQFWGDECTNYYPSATDKYAFNIINSVANQIVSTFINSSDNNTLLNTLAIICGQPFQEINQPYFLQDGGIVCLLKGLLMSGSWLLIDCTISNIKSHIYDKINSIISDIRDHSKEQMEGKSVFLKTINQIWQGPYTSACFLSFNSQQKFGQIPNSYRNQMRPLTVVLPPFIKFISESRERWDQLQTLKALTSIKYENIFFYLAKIYQKNYGLVVELQIKKQLSSIFNWNIGDRQKFYRQRIEDYYSSRLKKEDIMDYILSSPDNHLPIEQLASNRNIITSAQPKSSSFSHTLYQKSKIQFAQIISKAKIQIVQNLSLSKVVILYGSLDSKAQIVTQIINQMQYDYRPSRILYSYSSHTLPQDRQKMRLFLQNCIQKIKGESMKSVLKRATKKQTNSNIEIILHFQDFLILNQILIKRLLSCLQQIQSKGLIQCQNSAKIQVSIKIIIDCLQVSELSPSTLLQTAKVLLDIPQQYDNSQYFCSWLSSNIKIDKQRSQDSRVNYESVMYQLCQLQPTFENILNLAMRALSVKNNQSTSRLRFILTERFLRMFKIYIDHLDDKEVDQYIDYDVNGYIKNSFVYCLYWTICVGFLQPHQHFIIEQSLLKQHFPEITQISELSKYMLNEQNQWLAWQTQIEQFSISEMKATPIYNIWISTEQNMKMYTNVIKFIQKGLRVMIIGQKCSGKSRFLRQISNFQMSYSTFLIDCHRLTTKELIAETTKNRVFYTKIEKKLQMIDDLHLPDDEGNISQIVKKIMEENILSCRFIESGQFYENRQIKHSMNTIITYDKDIKGEEKRGLKLLQGKFQQLLMSSYQQKQISAIFNPYAKFEFEQVKQRDNWKLGDSTSFILSYVCKIYKKFSVDFHLLNRAFKHFISNFSATIENEKRQEPPKVYSANNLTKMLNFSLHIFLHTKPNYEAMESYFFQQTQKIMGASVVKNLQQFQRMIKIQTFYHLPSELKLISGEHGNKGYNYKQKMNIFGDQLQRIISERTQSIGFLPTIFHTELVFKIYELVKVQPSHIILLNQVCESDRKWLEPNSFGMRTISKMVGALHSINFYQVQNEMVNNFVSEALNIIKVGGKIDQSLYYVSLNGKFNEEKQMITIINSLICSPELHQFFTEQRIEQIFVKFCSEKKSLKRSEFIKRVRDKINLLFHFVISVNHEKLQQLIKKYPNLSKECTILPIHKIPEEALYQISNRILKSRGSKSLKARQGIIQGDIEQYEQQRYRRSVTKSIAQIFGIFKSLIKKRLQQKGLQYMKYKVSNIYSYFNKFEVLRKRYDELNNKEDSGSQMWSMKRAETEQKYGRLLRDRKKILDENSHFFGEQQKLNEKIAGLKGLMEFLINDQKDSQLQCSRLQQSLQENKNERAILNSQQYSKAIKLQRQIGLKGQHEVQKAFQIERFRVIFEKLNWLKAENSKSKYKQTLLTQIVKIRESAHQQIIQILEQIEKLKEEQFNEDAVVVLLIEWCRSIRSDYESSMLLERAIKQQEQKLNTLVIQMKQTLQKIQSKQIQLNETKKQLDKVKQDNEKVLKQYSQLTLLIEQIEPILKIFKHFEAFNNSTAKSKNKVQKSRQWCKMYGTLLLTTSLLQFSYYLPDYQDYLMLCNQTRQVIRQNQFILDAQPCTQVFFGEEEQLKNKYYIGQGSMLHDMIKISIDLNNCSVVKVKDESLVSLYQWMVKKHEKTVSIIQNNELNLLNECITNGLLGLVVNPSSHTVKKLRTLIKNEVEIKNNIVYVNITEQIALNSQYRLVFIFTESYLRQGKHYSELDNLWHLCFYQQSSNMGLEELCSSNYAQVNSLISEYINIFKELEKIDKKIEKIVMSIRKNQENADRVIMKIQSLSQEKQGLVIKANQIKSLLNQNASKAGRMDEGFAQLQDCFKQSKLGEERNRFVMFVRYLMQKEQRRIDMKKWVEVYQSVINDCYQSDNRFGNQANQCKFKKIENIQRIQKLGKQMKIKRWGSLFDLILKNNRQQLSQGKEVGRRKEKGKQNMKLKINQKLLIYKTSYVQRMLKYFYKLLNQASQEEVLIADISSLSDINNSESKESRPSYIAQIRRQKDWKHLSHYFSEDQKFEAIYPKLLILCDKSIDIPLAVKSRVIVFEEKDERRSLIETFCENPTSKMIDCSQLFKYCEKHKNNKKNINLQRFIEELLAMNERLHTQQEDNYQKLIQFVET